MASKLLTVFGATGNQGGSVIATVLSTASLKSKYALRGISQDPTKGSAAALADRGVEMVQADLKDPESLKKAVQGSYAVFAVTNFWEIGTAEGEISQGKNITDACLAAGVKHLVWSSLPNVSKLTNGELVKAVHFDAKAAVEDYIESVKKDKLLASYFMPGFFMSNIKTSIRPGPDGTPTWAYPLNATETHIPLLDVRADTGKFVMGLLEAGESANGVKVQGVSEWNTPGKVVEQLNATTSKGVVFKQIPPDVFSSFLPEAVRDDLTENMLIIRDHSYYEKGAETKQGESDKYVVGDLVSWEEYVKANGPW